ncbi:MAG: hypothetical protein PHV95_10980 [Eubacteriales bacterium]|nr:hypothetical protein [Eubacteriales bacterium]
MKKKFESAHSKKNDLSTVTIMSLKSFNDENFCKLKQIVEIFSPQTLYFDFDVFERDKEAICRELEILDENSKYVISKRKNKGRLAYQGSINNLDGILRIIVKYNLEESIFFEPKNFTWEQFLLDGTFEDKFYLYDTTDVLFTVCNHDGFHFIAFRSNVFNYDQIILKINQIL